MIVVDDDGLVVVSVADTAAVLEHARALEAREAAFRTRVEAGESTLDFFGIKDPLRDGR